jgi:hypothetical protein
MEEANFARISGQMAKQEAKTGSNKYSSFHRIKYYSMMMNLKELYNAKNTYI